MNSIFLPGFFNNMNNPFPAYSKCLKCVWSGTPRSIHISLKRASLSANYYFTVAITTTNQSALIAFEAY